MFRQFFGGSAALSSGAEGTQAQLKMRVLAPSQGLCPTGRVNAVGMMCISSTASSMCSLPPFLLSLRPCFPMPPCPSMRRWHRLAGLGSRHPIRRYGLNPDATLVIRPQKAVPSSLADCRMYAFQPFVSCRAVYTRHGTSATLVRGSAAVESRARGSGRMCPSRQRKQGRTWSALRLEVLLGPRS